MKNTKNIITSLILLAGLTASSVATVPHFNKATLTTQLSHCINHGESKNEIQALVDGVLEIEKQLVHLENKTRSCLLTASPSETPKLQDRLSIILDIRQDLFELPFQYSQIDCSNLAEKQAILAQLGKSTAKGMELAMSLLRDSDNKFAGLGYELLKLAKGYFSENLFKDEL